MPPKMKRMNVRPKNSRQGGRTTNDRKRAAKLFDRLLTRKEPTDGRQ